MIIIITIFKIIIVIIIIAIMIIMTILIIVIRISIRRKILEEGKTKLNLILSFCKNIFGREKFSKVSLIQMR